MKKLLALMGAGILGIGSLVIVPTVSAGEAGSVTWQQAAKTVRKKTGKGISKVRPITKDGSKYWRVTTTAGKTYNVCRDDGKVY